MHLHTQPQHNTQSGRNWTLHDSSSFLAWGPCPSWSSCKNHVSLTMFYWIVCLWIYQSCFFITAHSQVLKCYFAIRNPKTTLLFKYKMGMVTRTHTGLCRWLWFMTHSRVSSDSLSASVLTMCSCKNPNFAGKHWVCVQLFFQIKLTKALKQLPGLSTLLVNDNCHLLNSALSQI